MELVDMDGVILVIITFIAERDNWLHWVYNCNNGQKESDLKREIKRGTVKLILSKGIWNIWQRWKWIYHWRWN